MGVVPILGRQGLCRSDGSISKHWFPPHEKPTITHSSYTPVEDSYEHFQRSGACRQHIFNPKQCLGRGHVGEGTEGEGSSSKAKTDDGKILEMPAIALVSGCDISVIVPDDWRLPRLVSRRGPL